MTSRKLPQIVEVEWIDSVGSSGWGSLQARLDSIVPEDMDHRTAGYLLKSNRDYVLVAQSVGDHNPAVADTIQIPRRAIKRMVSIPRKQSAESKDGPDSRNLRNRQPVSRQRNIAD